MKWGRRKLSAEFSSSRHSLISHVFSGLWLSKFKQKSRDVEARPVKGKQEWKRSSGTVGPEKRVLGTRGGRFYSGEGDDFWRLSFGEQVVQRKASGADLTSVWYDSDNKLDVPPSVCQSCGSNGTTLMGNEDIDKLNNLILYAREMRELPRDVETSREMDMRKREEIVTKTERVPTEERKLKKLHRRCLNEKCPKIERGSNESKEKSRKSVEKDDVELDPLGKIPRMEREIYNSISAGLKNHHYVSSTNSRNSNLSIVERDGAFAVQNLSGNYGISAEKMSLERERLKEMKIRELQSKSENQRKSLYISREFQTRKTKQSSKIKVGSPRIKALEDMKKAKLKMKKGKKKTIEGRTNLESFAVVKYSFDPQKDFRDSMIEMLLEKRFSQSEELEELLACYLTLNSDEYHDLIIKVFRQVWFDLNQACFDELQNENCWHS